MELSSDSKHLTFMHSIFMVRKKEHVLFLDLHILFMILLFSFYGTIPTSESINYSFHTETSLMMKKPCLKTSQMVLPFPIMYIRDIHGIGRGQGEGEKITIMSLNLSSYSRIYHCSFEEIQHLSYNQRINISCQRKLLNFKIPLKCHVNLFNFQSVL